MWSTFYEHFEIHFLERKLFYASIPTDPIDNIAALVQAHKPLPEPMITQFMDRYMRHQASTS